MCIKSYVPIDFNPLKVRLQHSKFYQMLPSMPTTTQLCNLLTFVTIGVNSCTHSIHAYKVTLL